MDTYNLGMIVDQPIMDSLQFLRERTHERTHDHEHHHHHHDHTPGHWGQRVARAAQRDDWRRFHPWGYGQHVAKKATAVLLI